jgi:hypothetical protein
LTHQPKTTAPKTNTTAAGTAPLNEREQRILICAIVHCTKTPVEIDYPKLATLLGLKDRNSSKSTWHGLKKKLEAAAPKIPTGNCLLTSDPIFLLGTKRT